MSPRATFPITLGNQHWIRNLFQDPDNAKPFVIHTEFDGEDLSLKLEQLAPTPLGEEFFIELNSTEGVVYFMWAPDGGLHIEAAYTTGDRVDEINPIMTTLGVLIDKTLGRQILQSSDDPAFAHLVSSSTIPRKLLTSDPPPSGDTFGHCTI